MCTKAIINDHPPHFKRVATLPCEILTPGNQRVLCAVADLLKDELAAVLTYGKQAATAILHKT